MIITFKGETYETHPAADLFPLLEGDDLQALADDIRKHGLKSPIVLYKYGDVEQILDGRNRLRACEISGVPPVFDYYSGAGSPTAWVISQNLHRRHLDASQRSMVVADLMPVFEAEAKERQGRRSDLRANLPEGSAGRARDKAAEVAKVSPRLVADAVVVKREAPPEIVEAVKAGTMAVSAAAKAIREEKPSPFATRPRRRTRGLSGSASRIPASIPKFARKSIPEFSIFIRTRFTSTDRIRLARLLLDEGESAPGGA